MEQVKGTPVETKELEVTQVVSETEKARQVEELCRWGAARAGLLAASPKFSFPALVANDVYMVVRIAQVHGKCPATNAVIGFLLGACGSAIGNLVSSKVVKVPLAAGMTYCIGKAADLWVREGMPSNPDMECYRQRLVDIYEHNKETIATLVDPTLGSRPLGNEQADFVDKIHGITGPAMASGRSMVDGFVSNDTVKTAGAVKDLIVASGGVVVAALTALLQSGKPDGFRDNMRHATEGVSALLSVLAEQAGSLAGHAASASKDSVSHLFDESVLKVDEMRNRVQDNLAPHIENVKERVQPLVAKGEDAVAPVLDKLHDAVIDAREKVEPVVETVKERVQPVVEKAQDAAQVAVEKAQGAASTAAGKAQEVVQKAADKAQDIQDKLK